MHDQYIELSQTSLQLRFAFSVRTNLGIRLSGLLAIIVALARALLKMGPPNKGSGSSRGGSPPGAVSPPADSCKPALSPAIAPACAVATGLRYCIKLMVIKRASTMTMRVAKTRAVVFGISLGLLALPVPLAAEEAVPRSVEDILRSCADFSAGLTNFYVNCTCLYDHGKPRCESFEITAALPDRLRVLSDDYFNPVIWNYSFGQVSISWPSTGELIEHPAAITNFPYASPEAPEEFERGLCHSDFLPDLLAGRLADRLLAQAIDPDAPSDGQAYHYNNSICYGIRIPQADQTAYELRIQQGPEPFLLSIRQVMARAELQSDLAVEEKALAEEWYGQWQVDDPANLRQLTEAGPAPEPTEDETALVEDAEAPADETARTNGIPAHTASSHYKRQDAFLKRVLTDHFAKRADPRLADRDLVLNLLDDYRQYLLHDTPREDGVRLQREAEELLDRNPDLPTLRYVVALLAYFNDRREGAAGVSVMLLHDKIYPLLESAGSAFRSGHWKNPYLAMRTAYWRAYMNHMLPDPQWAESAWELYLKLLDDSWFVQQNAPVLVSVCEDFVSGKYTPISQKTRGILADIDPVKTANPWLYHMLCGVVYLADGWAADEFLRAQDPNIQRAVVHLNTAYRLDPSQPDAATYMISAMLARCQHLAMRKWFDRAVQVEMDRPEAYSRYVTCLTPLWGGTDEEWYAFGEECLKTGRFDTPVPGYFLDAVQSISCHNADSPLDVYRRPGCYENLMALFDGWQSAPGNRKTKRYWASRKAAYAWACGRYSEAAEILAHLGPNFDDSVLPELNLDREQLRNEVELLSSPHRANAEQALLLLAQGDLAGARQALEPALAGLEEADPSCRAFNNLLRSIQTRESFQAGQWVSLLQPGVVAWNSPAGSWHLRNEELEGQTLSDKPSTVECRLPLAWNFEMQGIVEFGESLQSECGNAVGRTLQLELKVANDDQCPQCGISLMIYENPPQANIRGIGSETGQDHVAVHGVHFSNPSSFLIQQTNNRIRVTWNDQVLADGLVVQSLDGREYPYSLSFTWDGTEVGKPGATFTSLKVRGGPSSAAALPSPDEVQVPPSARNP